MCIFFLGLGSITYQILRAIFLKILDERIFTEYDRERTNSIYNGTYREALEHFAEFVIFTCREATFSIVKKSCFFILCQGMV